MAPPSCMNKMEKDKRSSSSRKWEDPSMKLQDRSNLRQSYQPGRPRSAQKYSPKSSSLLNVSKISEAFENKNTASVGDNESRNTQPSKRPKMKATKPAGKPMTARSLSSDPLDSGFTTSRRGSFTSHVSSHSERSLSLSSCSDDTLSIDDIDIKRTSEECKPKINKIGFGHLPDQVHKKAVRRGFEFSLMVVGESGLGKSTLVNSMFLEEIYEKEEQHNDRVEKQTLQVETHKKVLEENGVKLVLTVVDTPGFGDAVDNTDCWEPIIEYVEKQFEDYLERETKVDRVEVPDTRVHACLYFIAPTGHGLKPLDVQCMKRIHQKVNIVPVIGKSDSCTKKEMNMFKRKILAQLEKNQIQVYDFPENEMEPANHWMRSLVPFSVVGSNTKLVDGDGAKYRGREYPWGVVNIEDQSHCDFSPLRHLLLATHMQDLKDVTHAKHYEDYRRQVLGGMLEQEIQTREDYHSDSFDNGRFNGMEFDWEGAFGNLTHERLAQLQKYASDQDYVKKFSVEDLPHERQMKEYPENKDLKNKMLWNKVNSLSLQELRQKSVGTMLGGQKMKNLMNAIKVTMK